VAITPDIKVKKMAIMMVFVYFGLAIDENYILEGGGDAC